MLRPPRTARPNVWRSFTPSNEKGLAMSFCLMYRAGGAAVPQPTPPEPGQPAMPHPRPPALEVPPPEIVEPTLPGHYPFHDPLRPVPLGIQLQ